MYTDVSVFLIDQFQKAMWTVIAKHTTIDETL